MASLPVEPAHGQAAIARHARSIRAAAWLAALVFGLALPCAALAADTLAAWRSEARRIRLLAENDVPRAFDEALRLEAALPPDALPADRVLMLNLRARIELYLARTEDAGRHARLAFEQAKLHGDRVGQVEADLNLALITVNEGNIEGLIESATRSLELLDGLDRPGLLGEAMLRTAMMYRRIGQIDESITLCMQAMEIAQRSNDPLVLTYAHQCLGISFNLSDRFTEARDHFLQMRRFAREAGMGLLEADALTSLGGIVAALGDPGTGESYLREAIDLYRAIGAPFNLNHGLFSLAHHLRMQGQPARAEAYLDEIVARYAKHPNQIGLWYTLMARSEVYQAQNRIIAAQTDAELSYALARDMSISTYRSDSALRLSAVVAASGDYQRAYALSREAADIKAKAEREKSGTRMIQLGERYESEVKRRQIEDLTRRNALQTAELERRALERRWLWTVLLGSAIALAGSALFVLRLRQSHRLLKLANGRLRRSQEDIRALNTGLEQRVAARTAELRQQTRYLRTLIDTLPWWVWFKDTDSRYLAVNQAAADTCGMSGDELVGKCDFDVRPRELAQAFRNDDLEVMRAKQRKTTEELQIVPTGTIWMETFKAPVIDEDGTVLGTVGFARDISERKATEAAREAALAEAQRLAKLRSEFLAQMSHELRTPLNGILGYAQILQLDKDLDERQRAGLNVIRQSGEHLLTLINDILDLAKIEAGKLELSPSEIRLNTFLVTIAEIIRLKAEAKSIRFVLDVGADLPVFVRADERRLRQVLLNLLANAVKFTEHGQVSLRVVRAASRTLHFEVNDTGIGIDPAHYEAIFQPFEQAGELPRRIGGAGLGLSISRQFVRLMGGDIHVESRPGEGSTFWFDLDLPMLDRATEPAAAEHAVVGYEGGRLTVLVIDDVTENCAVLADMLQPLGFDTVQATNAAEGLRLAEALHPQLIMMDVVMPDMDGLEAARRIRQMPALEGVPIIGISAGASGGDAENCRAAGMNAFLAKPVVRTQLLECIAALTGIRWLLEAPVPAAASRPEPAARFEAPPRAEMERLHQLALEGNMRDIVGEATRIADLDERFRPFAEQVSLLAAEYQSQALLRLVESHFDTPPAQDDPDAKA